MALETFIVLLRGVMPTGRNKVPMAPLRAALEAAGLENVRTYIQSGNVVVSTALGQEALEQLVHEVIAQEFGGDIRVLARPASYFRWALGKNPFKDADPKKLYFTLLASEPEGERLENFLAADRLPNNLEVNGDNIHFLTDTTFSDLKIDNAFIERKLKVPATTRVYRTITRLVELADTA